MTREYRSSTGRELTDGEIERLADDAENKEYDVEALKARRRGRPTMGSGVAEVVPVRIDPELKRAIETRAAEANTSVSEIIREALRRFLGAA